MSLSYITHGVYAHNGCAIACLAYKQDGIMLLMITSDASALKEWMDQGPSDLSAARQEDLLSWVPWLFQVEDDDVRRGTRIITGWSARAFTSELLTYQEAMKEYPVALEWQMEPYTFDTMVHYTKEALDGMRETVDPRGLELPHDAAILLRGAKDYQICLVYSVEQVFELAARFPDLASEILARQFVLQEAGLIPRQSEHAMQVIGSDSWIDQRAAGLLCMWKRVNRVLKQAGLLDA